MKERIHNYMERILARNIEDIYPNELLGELHQPLGWDELPEELQILLGSRAAEQATRIGDRTASLHLALLSLAQSKDFQPEEFSLHYQRSLFSSMQSRVRETYQNLHKKFEVLPLPTRLEAEKILHEKEQILSLLKRIYSKKLDVLRIRIHSTYGLNKILFTGKDLVIQDFGGDPLRSFSERRIKRSPLRDVADMICSFYYVAYEGFFSSKQVPKENIIKLLPFAEQWAHYMSGFFLRSYFEKVGDTDFVPDDAADFKVLMQTLLLERAIRHLNNDLKNRPEWALVPMHIVESILKYHDTNNVVQA
jgi:maltose alpha-D-glucosyltransferase/alpha-amylase